MFRCYSNTGGTWGAVASLNVVIHSFTMTTVGQYILLTGGWDVQNR